MQTETAAVSKAAISRNPDWEEAVEEVLAATSLGSVPSILLLFASYHFSHHYERLLQRIGERTHANIIIGCSGQGVIGPHVEVEGEPALSVLQLRVEEAELRAVHVTQQTLAEVDSGRALAEALDIPPSDANAWLLLADPFRLDVERLLVLLEDGYPGSPLIGGLASSGPGQRGTSVFLNGAVFGEGAVALALGGNLTVRTLVSQGATPIGRPWTVTAAHANVIDTIGGRPAYEVLAETVRELPDDIRERAVPNLLVGLAMDEYRDKHLRGDFLIRNLVGADRDSGELAIGAHPRVGQTVQFQMRDAQAADEELTELLRLEREAGDQSRPSAAILCSCNGRGRGLFGVPNHDAARIGEILGPLPLSGFFCNGEIGPVGGHTFVHGFTASLALIVPTYAGAVLS